MVSAHRLADLSWLANRSGTAARLTRSSATMRNIGVPACTYSPTETNRLATPKLVVEGFVTDAGDGGHRWGGFDDRGSQRRIGQLLAGNLQRRLARAGFGELRAGGQQFDVITALGDVPGGPAGRRSPDR